jgi:hypothetical protein
MEPHRHDAETGEVVLIEDDTPSPEEVAARAAEHAAEADAGARVEVARIEAEAAVELAKVQRGALDDEERIELEALRLEVNTLRDIAVPPEPEPVMIPAAEPADAEPAPDDMALPPAEGSPAPDEPARRKTGLGMW